MIFYGDFTIPICVFSLQGFDNLISFISCSIVPTNSSKCGIKFVNPVFRTIHVISSIAVNLSILPITRSATVKKYSLNVLGISCEIFVMVSLILNYLIQFYICYFLPILLQYSVWFLFYSWI